MAAQKTELNFLSNVMLLQGERIVFSHLMSPVIFKELGCRIDTEAKNFSKTAFISLLYLSVHTVFSMGAPWAYY